MHLSNSANRKDPFKRYTQPKSEKRSRRDVVSAQRRALLKSRKADERAQCIAEKKRIAKKRAGFVPN
jgi:hypothetical protein